MLANLTMNRTVNFGTGTFIDEHHCIVLRIDCRLKCDNDKSPNIKEVSLSFIEPNNSKNNSHSLIVVKSTPLCHPIEPSYQSA